MTNITQKNSEAKLEAKESLLTPRFYTTNFQELSQLDITSNQSEIEAIVEEFRMDYNRDHFVRDQEFFQSWDKFDNKTRTIFIEFLERSCTAEFSGFLLYKEISRNLKKQNPLLAEGFSFMSRDEARHAGFLNKAMSDFNVSLDLGFLTKTRKYTFFAPKFIFYATYLSEKIGYWRYITIYRHLEKNPNFRIYPIFRFFESWCQDENRHGDFFAALLKSQRHLLNTWQAKLWCRFFLLSVFVTMYLNDFQRNDFYQSIGLNTKQFDQHVIRKTNQSSVTLFPIMLDVENPSFFAWLDICNEANETLVNLEKEDLKLGWFKSSIQRFQAYSNLVFYLFRLYCLPVRETHYEWTQQFN
jgi:magnesium-protoporphyrin IX monomethyl ester (oxidative) cyclase